MEAPCCVGVVRDSSALVGKEISLGKSLKAYYAAPKVKNGKRMGIVVVHDIFGPEIPNCKYLCDHFASKGYDAVMPFFYQGKGLEPETWPATESEILKELSGDDFQKWFGSITSDSFFEKVKKECDDSTAFLRRKGCLKYGIVGVCWGGKAAETVAAGGRFSACISLHGCMHSADSYKAVNGHMLYVGVPDDTFFNKASQDEIMAAGGKVNVFDGMYHGFTVRGDFSKPEVKSASDKALEDTLALLSMACLRKPKYSKVGTIHPNSKGINCVVKLLTDATEVEEPRRSGGVAKFYEITCGDETGQVILSLKDFQREGMDKDKVMTLRNASVRMVKGFVRVVVDKWGKLDLSPPETTVTEIGDKNLSKTEYELVTS